MNEAIVGSLMVGAFVAGFMFGNRRGFRTGVDEVARFIGSFPSETRGEMLCFNNQKLYEALVRRFG